MIVSSGNPRFDPTHLQAAITAAIAFWQERLHLQDWLVNAPLMDPKADSSFRLRHNPEYRTVKFYYAPAKDDHWREVDDRWCAHAICHEMMHLALAPLGDIIFTNLSGPWYRQLDRAEETCCDRLATLLWSLIVDSERAMLTDLFAQAREKPRKGTKES